MLIKSKGDTDCPGKHQKLNAKANIGYLVGYESTNIYRIWISHKKNVISARDVIFNEDKVWDKSPIRLTLAEIQELDNAVEVVEVPQTEDQKDIQLAKDLEADSNPITVRVLTECDSSLASSVPTERILTHEEKKKKKKWNHESSLVDNLA